MQAGWLFVFPNIPVPVRELGKINQPYSLFLPWTFSSPKAERGITSVLEDTARDYELRSRGPATLDHQALDIQVRRCALTDCGIYQFDVYPKSLVNISSWGLNLGSDG